MLNKINDVSYLEELSKDIKALNVVIQETNGFVLTKMAENSIFPDISILLDNLDNYKVKFILENYKINASQSLIITKFSNEEEYQVKTNVNNKVLTESEIIDYLNQDKELPINTVIPFEIIKENTKLLTQAKEHENTGTVLRQSIANLNDEEILEIKEFLSDNIFCLNDPSLLTIGRKSRELYKELVLNAHKNNVTDEILSFFKNYDFDENEKEFLVSLMQDKSNWRFSRRSYANFSLMRGAADLVNKYEYFELSKNYDFNDFTIEEIKENLDFFHNIIIDNPSYRLIDEIINWSVTDDKFKTIINKEFFKKFIQNAKFTYEVTYDKDKFNDNYLNKFKYIVENFLDVITSLKLENENMLNLTLNLLSEVDHIKDYKGDSFTLSEKFYKNKYNFYKEYLFNKIDNDNTVSMLGNPNIRDFDDVKILSEIYEESGKGDNNKFNSINGFLILLKISSGIASSSNRSSHADNLKIQDLLTLVYNNLLKNKNNHYYLNKILEKNINSNSSKKYDNFINKLKGFTILPSFKKNNENNILIYKDINIENISEEHLLLIYEYDNNVLNKIIKDKVLVGNNFIFNILNELNRDSKKIRNEQLLLNFLKEYINIHGEAVHNNEDLVKSFFINKKQSLFYPYENHEFENLFNEMIEVQNKLNFLKDFNSNMKNKVEYYGDDDSTMSISDIDSLIKRTEKYDVNNVKENNELYKNIVDILRVERDFIKTFLSNVSYDFIDKKLIKLVENEDFATFKLLRKNGVEYSHNSVFENYVKSLNFEQLNRLLDNEVFSNFIVTSVSYDGKTSLSFKSFNTEENIIIAKKLLNLFKENKYSNDKIFAFFDENSRDFIKDFAIEHMPSRMVYGYDFFYNENHGISDLYKNFVKSEYTNEDLIKIYENLEKGQGFFSEYDVNADYGHFFNKAIFSDRNDDAKKKGLKKFLELLKMAEKYPKFYLILSYEYIFKDGLTWGKDYKTNKESEFKTSEHAINHFFVNNFNFDILLKGVEEIHQEIKEKGLPEFDEDNEEIKKINLKVAHNPILRFINNTYYEYDHNYERNNYDSLLGEEKTLKLIKLLYEKFPTYIVERNVIGVADNMVDFLSKHIDNFMDLKNIENFLIPDYMFISQYFNMENSSNRKNSQIIRTEGFVNAIVDKMINDNDIEGLKYINHILSQYAFFHKELDYSKASQMYINKSTQLLDLCNQDETLRHLSSIIAKMDLDKKLVKKEPIKRERTKVTKV